MTSATARFGVSGILRALAAVAVLDHRLVAAQVEGGGERSGPVRRRQRRRLPAAHGQAQRGVLQLRLRWRPGCGQLAEQLSVRMQRVAGGTPFLVGEGRPPGRRPRGGRGGGLSGDLAAVMASEVLQIHGRSPKAWIAWGHRPLRWRAKLAPWPLSIRFHDFIDKTKGKVIPYGVYDLRLNRGWVSVGDRPRGGILR